MIPKVQAKKNTYCGLHKNQSGLSFKEHRRKKRHLTGSWYSRKKTFKSFSMLKSLSSSDGFSFLLKNYSKEKRF
jgi:hypothetical protein